MKIEHLLITGIGVLLFLFSFTLRESYFELVFVLVLGIALVYLGLKLNNDRKKNK
jgi:hypothetical protein